MNFCQAWFQMEILRTNLFHSFSFYFSHIRFSNIRKKINMLILCQINLILAA